MTSTRGGLFAACHTEDRGQRHHMVALSIVFMAVNLMAICITFASLTVPFCMSLLECRQGAFTRALEQDLYTVVNAPWYKTVTVAWLLMCMFFKLAAASGLPS